MNDPGLDRYYFRVSSSPQPTPLDCRSFVVGISDGEGILSFGRFVRYYVQ